MVGIKFSSPDPTIVAVGLAQKSLDEQNEFMSKQIIKMLQSILENQNKIIQGIERINNAYTIQKEG